MARHNNFSSANPKPCTVSVTATAGDGSAITAGVMPEGACLIRVVGKLHPEGRPGRRGEAAEGHAYRSAGHVLFPNGTEREVAVRLRYAARDEAAARGPAPDGLHARLKARTPATLSRVNVVVFDLETTGLSPERDGIIEIGALRVRGGEVVEAERFETLVRPTNVAGERPPIHWRAQQVHGITEAMVDRAPELAQVLPEFLDFVGDSAVVAHNIGFDGGFMRAATKRHGLVWAPAAEYCTVQLSRRAFPRERAHNLDVLAQRLGLSFEPGTRHRTGGDVKVTAHAFVRLMERLGVAG